MKCERCRFAPPVDAEGFQDECPFFNEHGKEYKDGSYGCTMNYQTLQKLQDEHDEDLAAFADDWGTKEDFKRKGWDYQHAIRNMMHMIGMWPEGLRHAYKRHGKIFYKPYRNYWSGNNKYLDYFSGALGIVEKTEPASEGKQPFYRLTDYGLKYLGRQLDVKIWPEED